MKRIAKLLVPTLLFLNGLAWAAGTPVDTEIANQASASYNDSSGQTQNTTSNQVITVVQQVYGISITPNGDLAAPGQTQPGLSGATVYFPYVVTNTGNGTDIINLTPSEDTADDFGFGSLGIIDDQNCNGTIDTGEPATGDQDGDGARDIRLAPDTAACVILMAEIPSGTSASAIANVDLQGASSGDASMTDASNWAQAIVTDAASFSATMNVNPSGQVAAGDTLTYTVRGSNNGAASAYGTDAQPYTGVTDTGLVLTNPIPAGATFAGNLKGVAGAGTVKTLYQTDLGWMTTQPTDLTSVTAVGIAMLGSGGFFPQTASFTMSYTVVVNPGQAAGSNIRNTGATLAYSTDGSDRLEITTNTPSNPIAATYGVAVGPNGDPTGISSGSSYPYKGWQITVPAPDQQTIDTATTPVSTGDTIYFKNTLQNTGNTSDSFVLAVSGIPNAWSCALRYGDGTTPMAGTVGPLAAGSTFDFVLACAIPQANTSATTTAQTLTITTTSASDPTASNTTENLIPSVTAGYGVNLTSDGNETLTTQTLEPGETFRVPFTLHNAGENADVYTLTTSLPSGWSAFILKDADCDAMEDETATTSSTGLMNPGTNACFVVVGSVPGNTTPGTNSPLSVTATSTTDGTVTDTIDGTYTVSTIAQLAFDPDRSGTITTPGTLTYTLGLRNAGNAAATISIPAAASMHGWTYQLSTDGSTWSGSLSSITLAAGASTPVYVRVIVPAGQPVGRVETTAFTATGSFPTAVGATTASDRATLTTTVVGGDLRLEKNARTCSDAGCSSVTDPTGGTAKPGQFIEYTLVATNIGTASISNVILMDPLPNYTDFELVHAETTAAYPDGSPATVLYSADGASWVTSPAGLSFAVGDAIYLAVDTDRDTQNSVSSSDELAPADTITVTLTVRVQ